MTETRENTTVVIVGAGVADMALATSCCVTASTASCWRSTPAPMSSSVSAPGPSTPSGCGCSGSGAWRRLAGDPIPHSEGGFYVDGEAMPIDVDDDNNESLYCPQQVLVRNLTDVFLRDGGDLRCEAAAVSLEDVTGDRPHVRYREADGTAKVIDCDFIAGCDGFHGVSRCSIPASVLTEYSHEYGYNWLSALAAVPTNPSGMAIHSLGLAGMIPRGPHASRIYLQCSIDDAPEQWPDARVWSELEARFGTPVSTGEIIDKRIVALRSVVLDPMSYGKLYLLGDAAHIVPPMSAKGIHLALHDTEVFARAVIRQVKEGDPSLLASYSETCLPHIWNYQAFATWITDTMHNAGFTGYGGEFRKQVARAELQRQFTSDAANKLFSELTAGTN